MELRKFKILLVIGKLRHLIFLSIFLRYFENLFLGFLYSILKQKKEKLKQLFIQTIFKKPPKKKKQNKRTANISQ